MPPRTKSSSSSSSSSYAATISGGQFAQLRVVLRAGQVVTCDGGALAHMREGVDRGKIGAKGGVSSFLGRIFADQSPLTVSYTGLSEKDYPDKQARTVVFAPSMPGEIMEFKLAKGEKMAVTRGGYLASSPNVIVTGKFNWRGIFASEGAVLPTVQSRDGEGVVWLWAYGSIERHDLKQGQSLLVDNGLFFACTAGTRFEIAKLGKNWTSTVLGGEGIGMRFKGPGTVYTQSHNFNDLVDKILALSGK
jgi:uncharacterized protein (AIM24 family)